MPLLIHRFIAIDRCRFWRRVPLWFAGLVLIALAGCSTAPPAGVQAVTPFDASRYMGQWYAIARLDHWFERSLSRVSAQYALQADGSVSVINRGYDAAKGEWKQVKGRALFTGDTSTASIKVSFFGPFFGGYHVVALDEEYRWAMVMGPGTGYLWILAREPRLPAEVKERLVRQAAAFGVDTRGLIWVDHTGTGG